MTLVVTKKSILGSWQDHFKAWAPSAVVVSLTDYHRDTLIDKALKQQADVFIVNWESLRLMPDLVRIPWLHIIGDEVQAIKNRKAQATVAYKKIKALFKTDMSGTWADNAPQDGWSILNHLYPSVWSSYHRFFNHHVIFREKINQRTGQSFKEVVGVADADLLQKQMAPFYIRRLKEVVAPDLPEKVYNTVRVRLHPKQRRAYDDMRRNMLAWVGDNESQPVSAPVVIAKLIRLQQFSIAYGEMRDVEEWVWKVVPADQAERVLRELELKGNVTQTRLSDKGTLEVRVRVPRKKLFLTDPSAKLDAVMDWLDEMPSNESAVVFGTSKMAINLLGERLKKVGESYGLLTGDVTSDAKRQELVDGFQAGKFRVFAGTIKAGGIGITLTRASRMGFLDRDWSPSANRQTEDRTHRIGQKRTCFYTDFVGEDTLDEKRNLKIELKWEWVKQILGDGTGK